MRMRIDTSKADEVVELEKDPPIRTSKTPHQAISGTTANLTMGLLWFRDAGGTTHKCTFQFNPTELERSRSVKFTRTQTGNVIESSNVGPPDQPKRKQTRKVEPWALTLSLRYDAGYYHDAKPQKTDSFRNRIECIAQAMRFFEKLAEPELKVSENESTANARETKPPPLLILQFGQRAWRCAVQTLRIKEQDFTYDLYLRRFEVTLNLEIIETVAQVELDKPGATG